MKQQHDDRFQNVSMNDVFDQEPWSIFDEVPEEEYIFPISYEEFLQELEASVFGQEEVLSDIAYDLYTYIIGSLEGKLVKHNFLLAGPSASGKTELYRTVQKVLKKYKCAIPVLHIDISGCSPSGFVGTNLSIIPNAILEAKSFGQAIVFLDEFDKILMPLHCTSSDFHEAIQHELLTLIEGRKCFVQKHSITQVVDTTKTLFVAMGAFTKFRKEREDEKEKFFGFSVLPTTESKEESLTRPDMEMSDLLAVGGIVELLGRFDAIYNFRQMTEDVFEDLFEHFLLDLGIEQQILISATEQAVEDFYGLAKSEFGCREVKRVLYQTIKPCLKKIVERDDRISLRILIRGIDWAELQKRK